MQIRNEIEANFDIYDVGGQRSERRHWIRIFQNVKAVLFVVAISEYNQLCFEDETTNRLDDALNVFRMVSNSKHFEETQIILLFNKIDLFKLKLSKNIPFSFENYGGEQKFEPITNFVRNKFESQYEGSKQIFTQFMCAIEENFSFDSVFKAVIQSDS